MVLRTFNMNFNVKGGYRSGLHGMLKQLIQGGSGDITLCHP